MSRTKLQIRECKNNADLYIDQINKINEWGKNGFQFDNTGIADEFLSGKNVAGVGQGRFNNKTKKVIKEPENWKKLFNTVVLDDENGHITIQKKLKEICEACNAKSIPWASIHAINAVLWPNKFCTIVSENNIDQLYKLLNEYNDYVNNKSVTSEGNETAEAGAGAETSTSEIELKFGEEWKQLEKNWKVAQNEISEEKWYKKSEAIHEYFKSCCGNQYWKKGNYPWETLVALRGNERIKMLKNKLELQKNLILTGAPGTGKTFTAKKIAEILTKKNNKQIKFVQFHPSYDYTDFVEGLRPVYTNTNTDTNTDTKQSVEPQSKKEIGFELKEGIFKKFCAEALAEWNEYWGKCKEKNEKKKLEDCIKNAPKYVFIIDEINRGEISKIFGELFFSIDPGYRGEEGALQTQYSNMQIEQNIFDKVKRNDKTGQFFVPHNVYIIGTMNDIDRSVESMDFAFRRRFAFVEIEASESENALYTSEHDSIRNNAEILAGKMQSLNKAIINCGFSSHYQIGVAYFLKYKDVKNYSALWNDYLKGTLYEYLRGEPTKVIEEKIKKLKDAYDNKIDDNDDEDN